MVPSSVSVVFVTCGLRFTLFDNPQAADLFPTIPAINNPVTRSLPVTSLLESIIVSIESDRLMGQSGN